MAGNRELPHIVGQLLILPKHYWEGTDAKGSKRDISKSTLEPPLGSGPYKIRTVVPGRTITFERVPDYWGKDLPVNVGSNNFDEIRYEYFRDDTVELEAFKADQIDWRTESTARVWATGYDFPAVKDKRVILEMFEEPYRSAGLMVGFIFNLNRDPFKDRAGPPGLRPRLPLRGHQQVDLLRPVHADEELLRRHPARRDGPAGGPRAGDPERGQGQGAAGGVHRRLTRTRSTIRRAASRNNLRAGARSSCSEAGWQLKGNKLVDADGQAAHRRVPDERAALSRRSRSAIRRSSPRSASTLDDPLGRQQRNTRTACGAATSTSIYSGWAQSMSPGNEQIEFFGSQSADREGSRNYRRHQAIRRSTPSSRRSSTRTNRDDLIAATKALDRVLLWNHYLVPGWTLRKARVARWDRYAHPDPLPEYSIGFPTFWWWDADKAAKTGTPQ